MWRRVLGDGRQRTTKNKNNRGDTKGQKKKRGRTMRTETQHRVVEGAMGRAVVREGDSRHMPVLCNV
jgi:hypothetical protein